MGRCVRSDRTGGQRPGKSSGPGRASPGPLSPPKVKEGAQADQAVTEAGRRTISRRELGRHEGFEEISPEVGRLDEDAFDDQLGDDPDAALALLADLVGATDERLRRLARLLAGRIVLDLARRGPSVSAGIGRLATTRYRSDGGDVDLDASLDALVAARAAGSLVDADDLRLRSWVRPGTAWCLLVDRSGSMGGRPLATSAVAAAAVAARNPDDYSVVAFGTDAIVVKSQSGQKAAEHVVTDLLTLRGFGTTDVVLALRTAAVQLGRSRAGRRITLLLSDCRATAPGDLVAAASGLDELVIIAPAGDSEEAEALARATGASIVMVEGPADVPRAFRSAFAS